MLNVHQVEQEVNIRDELVVCFDVSKDHLDGFARSAGNRGQAIELEVGVANHTTAIEEKLTELAGYAENEGFEGLHVVCEPTGGYERKLLRAARRLGHRTAYVNPEHVAKLSVVESGDTGKTDPSDARVIAMIAKLDRTQEARQLEGEYLLLRELGKSYEAEDKLGVQARTRMNHLLKELFCDYGKSSRFTFRNTGQAIMAEYRFNPYRIVADGFEQFRTRIKAHVLQVRERTLRELWNQAESSVRMTIPKAYRDLLEDRLAQLYEDYLRHQDRKDELGDQIARLYQQLLERGEVPEPFEELTPVILGRFIAQTGPLADFDHWRELLRYGGMNIRERKSGKYKGEERITKKGRALVRKVVGQMAFLLIRKDRLYSPYYQHKRKTTGKRLKALMAVMRKLVKLIYGLHNSDQPYDRDRVFRCEACYREAA